MANGVSHDQNFKNLILDYPREALALFATDEAPSPDDEVEITPLRQEQLKERLGDRFRELDVPLLVEWTDGRRDAILFMLEEETQARKFSPLRLLGYCADLAELCATDRIVPVAIFLGDAESVPASLTLGTERHRCVTFDYFTFKLAHTPFEHWRDSDNVVARVNLPNMRFPNDRKVEVYAQAIRGLSELEPDGDRREKYMEFIDIYAGLTHNEFQRYERQYPEETKVMAGAFQRARDQARHEGLQEGRQQGLQQGMQEGIQQGVRQGRVEGERAVLEHQLRRRFGLLSPEITDRLSRATAANVETWAGNVLDAETLEDVFDPHG